MEGKDFRDTCTPAIQKLKAEKMDIMEKLRKIQGELTLLIPCHVPDCTYNQKIKNLSQALAETYIQTPKFTLPLEEFSKLLPAPAKNPILVPNNPGSKNLKNKNSPGNGEFVSPSKHSKKPRMLENSDIRTVVSNKFSALAGATASTDLYQTSVPMANKISSIMFR
ncbi:hypothetical protein TNIN_305741 [Trichonephila inaurata madagascariensis]|uniref:Uncharacterized protein n=1 Tax=Trichonephila inaurata madagascariensis TaxID=2747483 RepID=A0A8X6YWZ1_9ARAC|nr:hypothetical protein TNIN_305741 [Trichonephila inaurata madagascariensis]